MKLQIWDTAGQDRFRNIVSTFYRNAHAIIVVYDVTELMSFKSMEMWFREIDRFTGPTVSRPVRSMHMQGIRVTTVSPVWPSGKALG